VSCPLTPRRCPFGGACHTCPTHVQAKRLDGREQEDITQVPPSVHAALHSAGQPLDAATRAFMEPRFRHDFSQVRVHTDAKAAESARAVNALAYTVEQNIVFGVGQYSPHTSKGRQLLAHELTHVMQQSQTSAVHPLRIEATNSVRENEAAKVSRQTSAGTEPSQGLAASVTPAPTATLQRQSGSDVGTLYLRLNENGRVEILYGTPDLPVVGTKGVGARCQNGRCQIVGSGNPADLGRTYTPDEVLVQLRRLGGGTLSSAGRTCPPGYTLAPIGCCPPGTMWGGSQCTRIPIPPGSLQLPGRQIQPPSQAPLPAPGQSQLHVSPDVARLIGSATLDSFEFGRSEVPSQHQARLHELAETLTMLLRSYSVGLVIVTGHTDAVGSEANNERLGQRRADAVKTALVSAGVPGDNVLTLSAGESQLLHRTQRPDAQNRRVQVEFQPRPGIGLGLSVLRLELPTDG
jgi:outer membrane protein OmpA-like peptidoglycan-associated protein